MKLDDWAPELVQIPRMHAHISAGLVRCQGSETLEGLFSSSRGIHLSTACHKGFWLATAVDILKTKGDPKVRGRRPPMTPLAS